MDTFALWIGYAVITISSLWLVSCFLRKIGRLMYRDFVDGMNERDVRDACFEWRERNPEKAAQFRQRNGIGDES